ncbi:MAG: transglycosylase SLT domain-containing protein, partial [Glaciimonas sp.]|nr:transglycosylase SLT domain-containing protein [Glaciimonas sp.]
MKNKKHDDRSWRNWHFWPSRWPNSAKIIAWITLAGFLIALFSPTVRSALESIWNPPKLAVTETNIIEESNTAEDAEEARKIKIEQHSPNARRYKRQLRQEAHMVWGLNAPISTFAAQIHQESLWNPVAKSRVGAEGLAQFMPATAVWISQLYEDLKENKPHNPTWSMRALVRYDKFLYDRVQASNPCERMAFALAAYNGGLGWVNKRKARSKQPLQCFGKTCDINPGILPSNQKENSDYPKRILLKHEPLYI